MQKYDSIIENYQLLPALECLNLSIIQKKKLKNKKWSLLVSRLNSN